MRKVRNNLIRKPPSNLTTLQDRKYELTISHQKRHAALNKKAYICIEEKYKNFTKTIKQASLVEEKESHCKLSSETKSQEETQKHEGTLSDRHNRSSRAYNVGQSRRK